MSPGPTSGYVTEPTGELKNPLITLEGEQYGERTWGPENSQSKNEGQGDASPGINFTCVWTVGVFPRHN